ncbi:MAG: DNA replication complex GINS family protein [Thermoplasmata archaeon]|nr:MAG: DNA replication complex GINS family protein [Thermoplasmata archaeon]
MAKQDEEFTFETIARVYREERKSTTLTKLPPQFYPNLIEYVEHLRNSYYEARKEDPTSSKTMMLEDEYNRSDKRANQIYEYRERKITALALSAVNGGDPNISFLSPEEKKAFEEIVSTLSKNRLHILSIKEESTCEATTFLPSEKISSPQESQEESEKTIPPITEGKSGETHDHGTMTTEHVQDNPVILILEDIPSFETEERTFNLRKDDVVSLPKKYANILCKNEKARVIRS